MTECQILESTYSDRADVYRRSETKDPVTKQTRQYEDVVESALRCALSQNKSGSLTMGGGAGSASSSYTLFCAPDIEVIAGDRLLILTAAGQQLSLWAGKPFVYPSHMEIPLTAEERT